MKIVQVANAMITKSQKIGDVTRGRANSKELFFTYDAKYKWSIVPTGDDSSEFSLFYYPSASMSIKEYAGLPVEEWPHVEFVTYNTSEIKTKESRETFSDLYRTVADKLYGLDEMFDRIING